MHHISITKVVFLSLAVILIIGFDTGSVLANELNCLMCHKHRGLSRIDENGDFQLFYINTELFESGPHRRNRCQDCHSDIDRIPHKPAEKVDCTQQCHIVEPSNNKKFSHKSIAETLAVSVHSKFDIDGKLKKHPDDYPGCKDCHDQPLYRPISVVKGVAEHGVSEHSLSHCKSCHSNGDFARDFFEHITSRLHETPKQIIEVCAKCHQNSEFRERHDLDDVVTSYKQTFHGKMVELGSDSAADCLDCHVVEGENNHLIEAQAVTTSATHKTNLGNTCRTSDCHKDAGPQLAGFQTHVTYDREKYPLQFYMLVFFKALMAIILYFFLTLIFLELLRRLFPGFSFFKDNQPHHKSNKPKPDELKSDKPGPDKSRLDKSEPQ